VRRIAFITVGCKLNQFETEEMREAAEACGYRVAADPGEAEVCVVNTCTVTSKSDYRSRQAVRRVLRANPGALVVVTGCYAQRKPDDVAAIKGVDLVLGNAEKQGLEAYLDLDKQRSAIVRTTPVEGMGALASRRQLHGFGRYTRAFVKIQDGCNNRCAYCAVPLARGGSRSKHPDEVRREVEILAAEGYKEIVLTGVHLGSYGRDLASPTSLATLLTDVGPTPGIARLRLSSVEPTDFSQDLIDLVAKPSSKVCPHVHVPLQSGDDRILSLMGRPYSAGFYRALIERIASARPYCGIGADVMVGFPGEDDAAFHATCSLIGDLPITYLHVFAFSRREGTVAAGLQGEVGPEVKKERSLVARTLGAEKSRAFRRSLVGETLETLMLGLRSRGSTDGLAGNYVKVALDAELAPNTMVRALVKRATASGVAAEPQTC
jgi:threonylcarbamoyladenosine tRNA methylthiotransferase MtaB